MSNLSHVNDPSEMNVPDLAEQHSPKAMVFTMLLLIAGFFFSSALFINQACRVRTAEGIRTLDLNTLAEVARQRVVPAPTTTVEEKLQEQADDSPLDNLKNLVQNNTSSVRWPKLRLTGIGISAEGSERFAIINGTLLHPGEYVGKVRLEQVRQYDVVVAYKGELKTLTVSVKD